MRPFFALVLCASLGALSRPARADGPKFGAVDVRKVMESTAHWKTVMKTLEGERTAKQAKLEARQTDLRKKKDALDAKRSVAKVDPKEEQALLADAQKLTQEFMVEQQRLTLTEKNLTDQMLGRIELVVREIAVAQDLDFVFERGDDLTPTVLYGAGVRDLTPAVIKLYQSRFKKGLDLSGSRPT